MSLFQKLRLKLRALFRQTDLNRDLGDELDFHIDMQTEENIRAGMTPEEARRQARLRFGGVEGVKEESRRAQGVELKGARASWLDFKLGFRMLSKYPGLTLVGGLAMGFAVMVGAGTFEFVTQVMNPTIPLDDGDRIVGIEVWNVAENGEDQPTILDLATWREELDAVEDLGGFRTVQRNLVTGGAGTAPVEVAEISASAFRVARVPPLLGRTLVEADESPSAPPVAVIGYELWQTRFAGDAGVVGQTVRLGTVQTTIVGVMPEGFAFPINHGFWTALRLNPLDYQRGGEAPELMTFGRLARGVSLQEANAEIETLGLQAAADFPETNEFLRPRILGYAESIFAVPLDGLLRMGVYSINLIGILLMALMCANVALLMFARAATREGEIAVRHALGASRGRIIVQLFVEALVLGGVATLVALGAVRFALVWWMSILQTELLEGVELPFWFHSTLSPSTVIYAIVLTVLGALVAGVLPALKVTHGLETRLRQASAGGGGFRFGGVWTAVIVAQIAITVFIPFIAYVLYEDSRGIWTADVGVAEEEYLTVRLEMDRPRADGPLPEISDEEYIAQRQSTFQELERRLVDEASVAGVTFADKFPRMYHPHRLVEIDNGPSAPLHPRWPAYRVSSAAVSPDYFGVLGAPVLAGRGFSPADAGPPPRESDEPGVVVINQSFLRQVLGGSNPIGRRVRYVYFEEYSEELIPEAERGPWYEIVGVVPDMGMLVGVSSGGDPKVAGFYHPVEPGTAAPAFMALHLRGDLRAFAPRLRAIAAEVDPALRLYNVVPMNELSDSAMEFLAFWSSLILLICAIALLLSLAGIYAVMAFTVAQRTREIGVRVALGGNARNVIFAIFKRPLGQVVLGVACGAFLILAFWIFLSDPEYRPDLKQISVVLAYTGVMLGVCLLACIVPTRRALNVEPTEALRAEG